MTSSVVIERPRRTAVRSRVRYPIVALLGFSGLAISAVAMIVLNLVASGQVDPVSSTMSNYVFAAGYGWLFPAALVGVAAGGFAVLLTLVRSVLGSSTLLRLTVLLASVCCLLVALFPTNRTGPLTLSAEIHRYAAGVAFCCVPIAALLIAARLNALFPPSPHGARLRTSALASALILVVFLASHLGLMPEFMQHLRGLFQRIQFAVQLLTLAQLLHTSTRPHLLSPCPRPMNTSLCRAAPTRVHRARTRVVDILPATLGWHTVGVWSPLPRSVMRSPSESPPSR